MRRLYSLLFAALLVAVMLPVSASAWVGPTLVQEDSIGVDTFWVSGNADIDTSEILSFSSAGLNDLHLQICFEADTAAVTIAVEQNIWPDATWEAYHWEIVDSIKCLRTGTGASGVVCSLYTPVFDVPPHDVRLLFIGRDNNQVTTGGGRGGTKVIVSYFREERDAD